MEWVPESEVCAGWGAECAWEDEGVPDPEVPQFAE